jgi:hypothetical protein
VTDEATGRGTRREAAALKPWPELSAIEQSLVRAGLRKSNTAGTIQAHGMALRWEGASHAPLAGGYSYADQRALVRAFADSAAGLTAQGVLSVRFASASYRRDTDHLVDTSDLGHVLHDPLTWIWDARNPSRYWLDVSQQAHARWYHSAYFAAARTEYPAWDGLSEPERAILVSAMEASGMLTGPFGIWSQPGPTLSPSQRLAAVDDLLAPLLPFVREGLLEVQYRADASSDAYTVVPLSELRSAFNGVEIWHDCEEAGFFEGAHAVFTFAGYATWHTPRTGC